MPVRARHGESASHNGQRCTEAPQVQVFKTKLREQQGREPRQTGHMKEHVPNSMGGLSKLGREGTLQEMAVNATRGGGISADGVPSSPEKQLWRSMRQRAEVYRQMACRPPLKNN